MPEDTKRPRPPETEIHSAKSFPRLFDEFSLKHNNPTSSQEQRQNLRNDYASKLWGCFSSHFDGLAISNNPAPQTELITNGNNHFTITIRRQVLKNGEGTEMPEEIKIRNSVSETSNDWHPHTIIAVDIKNGEIVFFKKRTFQVNPITDVYKIEEEGWPHQQTAEIPKPSSN
ncbi:MAG: hypothetical protein WD992_00370 [Candidatus Levyibacteriota bacterium]